METLEMLSEYELERGKPMPSFNHAVVQTRLITILSRIISGDLLILSELTIELESGPLTPDICIYPDQEVNWVHDKIRMSEPPLLVVEILSPKQYLSDLMEKMELYFAAGVKSGWLVQPSLRSIAVFTPDMDSTVYTSGELTDPALGITINLDEIFG
jgi:Uma2 family endonuclease